MEILGYVILAWFIGMLGADVSKPNLPRRESGDYTYQHKIVKGNDEGRYWAYGSETCRPQCFMSGTFYNGVLRPMVPWPFRKGQYFECPKDADLDICTGQIYKNKRWVELQ